MIWKCVQWSRVRSLSLPLSRTISFCAHILLKIICRYCMIKFDLAKWRQNQITETVKRGALNRHRRHHYHHRRRRHQQHFYLNYAIHYTIKIHFLGFIIFEDLLRHRTSESYFEVFPIWSFLYHCATRQIPRKLNIYFLWIISPHTNAQAHRHTYTFR